MLQRSQDGLLSRFQGAVADMAVTIIRKSGIWGEAYRTFMGMGDQAGGDVQEIGNSAADWTRAYFTEAWVARCVNVRVQAIKQVPLKCYDPKGKDGKPQEVEHPALELLETTNYSNGFIQDADLHGYSIGSR